MIRLILTFLLLFPIFSFADEPVHQNGKYVILNTNYLGSSSFPIVLNTETGDAYRLILYAGKDGGVYYLTPILYTMGVSNAPVEISGQNPQILREKIKEYEDKIVQKKSQ